MLSRESLKIKQIAVGSRIKMARCDAELTQSELAIEAGTTPQSWGKYEDGSVSPRIDLLLPLILRGYSLDWIFTGDGTMKPEITVKGKAVEKTESLQNIAGIRDGESFSMSDMLLKTSAVLESKTVYRSALASNIRAFHDAVMGEKEMKEVRDEVAALRKEIQELREELRSAKESDNGKKRDAQANE